MRYFLLLFIVLLIGGGIYYEYTLEQQSAALHQRGQQELSPLTAQLDQVTKDHQKLLDQKSALDKSFADLQDANNGLKSKIDALKAAALARAAVPPPPPVVAAPPTPAPAPVVAAVPPPPPPEPEEGASSTTGMLITDARIRAIKDRIDTGKEPQASAWAKCLQEVNWNLNRECQAPETWYVPARYVNNEAHQKAKKCLHDDANFSFKFAMAYRITGDEKYAEAAARLIHGWSTSVKTFSDKDDSQLAFSYHIPSMIFAADLIRNSYNFKQPQQDEFAAFLKGSLQMCTMVPKPGIPVQNGHDWGLLFYLSTGLYTHDDKMVQTALENYKKYIDIEIQPDGSLPTEMKRNNGTGDAAFWYMNFALMPLTICTELFRLHGTDLYDYTSPGGGSLKKAYERVTQLMENPGDYPIGIVYKGKAPHSLDPTFYAGYMEMLDTRWPNDEATAVLQGKRPWDPDHSLPVTTLLYGDLIVKDSPAADGASDPTDPNALPSFK